MEKNNKEGKHTNWFSRVLIILLLVFVACLVVFSSWPYPWRFTLTGNGVLLIMLLVILALSEIFDSFSLGSLLTLRREKKAKEERLREVSEENQQLRAQLTTIVSSSVANHNTTIFGMPTKEQLLSLIGTEPAEPDEVDEKEKEELASNAPAPETAEPAAALAPEAPVAASTSEAQNHRHAEVVKRRRMQSRIEDLCLDRYSEMVQVSKYSISRATKFSDAFVNIDPIMEQNIIFDAYCRSPLGEQFIEMFMASRAGSLDMYYLYHMLSKIYYYRNTTQQQARLVLLAVQLPESYSPGYTAASPSEIAARRLATLQKTFAPAIRKHLLEIVPIEITDDDITRIRKEVEESTTAAKTDDPT